jgi:hypothetical protein
MSSRSTLRNTLALWLVRRGLRLLSKPYWVIGAIGLLKPSPGGLAAHTYVNAPLWDQEQSVVNLALSELLSDIVNGRVTSSTPQPLRYRVDQDQESDGLPDAKSLH